EKTILPTTYKNINIFKDNQAELSQFYIFNSENDIIQRLTELITKENQNQIAIVTPKNSPLSSLAKSKLTSKGIQINHKTYLKEHFDVRLFLSLIELSFNISDIKVREILPYLELFDLEINSNYNNYVFYYYINRINKDANLEGFFSLIQQINQKTYSELMLILNQKLKLPKEFQHILKTLSLTQEKITSENFSELSYFVENFDININQNHQGVLFIDATNSSFIDRQLCFFLGLDNSWTRTITKEGLNLREAENLEQEKFLALLQQGKYQYYFTAEFTTNQLTIPCYYFNLLFNTKISSFLEPSFKPKKIRNKPTNTIYKPEQSNLEVKKDHLDLFSQSSFNNFVTCPKKYSYSKILPQEDQPHFMKGTLVHEFAEFYFEHKDFVKEKGPEEFVKTMVNKYKRINGDLNLDLEKTIFTIAVKNIINFIDALEVKENVSLIGIKEITDNPFSISKYKQKNIFAERFKLKLESTNTEATFSDQDFGIRGVIDLIINQNTIVDYKTSAYVKSSKDIIKASNFNLIKDIVDFQPSFYIMELRKYTQDSEIKFIYNFILANKDSIVDGKEDKAKNIGEVKYIPTTFNEFLTTKSAICLLASSKARSALIAALKDYNILIEFFKNNPLPKELQYNYEKLSNSDYAERFHKLLKEKLDESYSTYEEVINSFLKTITWLRTGERQKQALIFKEDIDEFEVFINKKNTEINSFLNNKFPYQPIGQDTCKNCDYKHICLKRFQ
ncbi:MAG: PD-(D/E)XK nuclease family protein, partial [Nanoarchaeota archaeon]|nr:PD-(D/E)XK nuclease family protein [Nanoarchaeota archaeon]